MATKMKDLRGMSDEQLGLTLKDTEKHLFQLRFQSATDRLETPSEIRKAKREKTKPTLICMKTTIGKGAPNKQGTSGTHGSALGPEEVAAARKELGWTDAPFVIPDDIAKGWKAFGDRGKAARVATR